LTLSGSSYDLSLPLSRRGHDLLDLGRPGRDPIYFCLALASQHSIDAKRSGYALRLAFLNSLGLLGSLLSNSLRSLLGRLKKTRL
jgi:hypothetical protein